MKSAIKGGEFARRLAVVAVAVGCLAVPATAQVVRVYAVKHRTAEELAPLVEPAIAGEGKVIADRRTNSLVLSGSERGVASALALLGALDVRARTVVLHYEARNSGELASAGASVRWHAGAGAFRVGDVAWPTGAAAVAVGVEGDAARHASTLAGELRILEGQTGRISSGTSLPLRSRR
ncbi:MAG TPA: secretin N-terminal domain-containing protein, partial [Myxococcota bacterium]|nr:secretin N-terminal domain-containing protein [Myxococcota bacterium]